MPILCLQIYTANSRENVLKSFAFIGIEMSQTGQKQKKNEQSQVDSYIWTDNEVEFLLKVTMEYKTSKAMENDDWESTRTKYDDILKRFDMSNTLCRKMPFQWERITHIKRENFQCLF